MVQSKVGALTLFHADLSFLPKKSRLYLTDDEVVSRLQATLGDSATVRKSASPAGFVVESSRHLVVGEPESEAFMAALLNGIDSLGYDFPEDSPKD